MSSRLTGHLPNDLPSHLSGGQSGGLHVGAATGPRPESLPTSASAQARVRHNDWSTLEVPALGTWTPTRTVSVVIPSYRAEATLGLVLAGLSAQSYPAHLLEVLVVDDSPEPMARLPELHPENTRLLRTQDGWGRGAACHTGALAAGGEIIHWLDSDMLVERDHVEAQLRWHELLDYAVVLGHKWFVDPALLGELTAEQVREQVFAGRIGDYFPGEREGHDWVEELYARTDDLISAGPRAHRAHVGASASLRRDLYLAAGGMNTGLRLGEDSELGYRLGECGAIFVPDREACSWHLGPTHVMRRQDEVNDYNLPFLADLIPDGRAKRVVNGRQYAVPYLEVVLDTAAADHADVVATVDAVLASSVPDLIVTLVGAWSTLSGERVSVLDDPQLDARLVHASYAAEPRVRLVEALPPGRSPAMLRLVLSSARWAPGRQSLNRMIRELEWTHHGLRSALMPDGSTARLERTAAYARALRVVSAGSDAAAGPDPSLDDVVDELFGSWWVDGPEMGFVAAGTVVLARLPGRSGPAQDPASLPTTEGGEKASARRSAESRTTDHRRQPDSSRPPALRRAAHRLRRLGARLSGNDD